MKNADPKRCAKALCLLLFSATMFGCSQVTFETTETQTDCQTSVITEEPLTEQTTEKEEHLVWTPTDETTEVQAKGEETTTEIIGQVDENKIAHFYQNMTYTYATKGIDESIFTTNLSQKYLILANKDNSIGDYVPENLVTVTEYTTNEKNIQLEERTYSALILMLKDMQKSLGVVDVYITSGYRDAEYQKKVWNSYVLAETKTISDGAIAYFGADYIEEHYGELTENAKLSLKDAETYVSSFSSKPGNSEHQTGLCVDFIAVGGKLTNESFTATRAYSWLCDNAYKYGFILRYEEGKEDITGYTFESWHWRFVGREAATDIFLADITLEEYLEGSIFQ